MAWNMWDSMCEAQSIARIHMSDSRRVLTTQIGARSEELFVVLRWLVPSLHEI
uniref:Uncharacterized protein n=1 Tax=Arundo donax TaxID=35708 RepID=A0A0A9AFP2_ARUDO